MHVAEYALAIQREIEQALTQLRDESCDRLTDMIMRAKRIFLAGMGRSDLVIRTFAMRLMHMGVEAYVVGETITPAIANGDLLIAGSGSGQTRGTLATVQAAAARGAQTAVITAHGNSQIAEAGDLVVVGGGIINQPDRRRAARYLKTSMQRTGEV